MDVYSYDIIQAENFAGDIMWLTTFYDINGEEWSTRWSYSYEESEEFAQRNVTKTKYTETEDYLQRYRDLYSGGIWEV